MVSCHDLKKGMILGCQDCGLELKVVGTCDTCCSDDDGASCSDEECIFKCCSKELVIKK